MKAIDSNARYRECLAFELAREGGYVNDPDDRGRATNNGITQTTYDEWRTHQAMPLRDVHLISSDEVSAIYKGSYWNRCECWQLPKPLDLVVFDSAVQHGALRACKWLQRIIYVTVNGVIDPKTLYAVNDYVMRGRLKQMIDDYMAIRYAFYAGIIANNPSQKKFQRGWSNRMALIETEIRKENLR